MNEIEIKIRALTQQKVFLAILLIVGLFVVYFLILIQIPIQYSKIGFISIFIFAISEYYVFRFFCKKMAQEYSFHFRDKELMLEKNGATMSTLAYEEIREIYMFNNSDYSKCIIKMKNKKLKFYIGLTDLPTFFDYYSPFRFKLKDKTKQKQLQNKVINDEELEQINMITKDVFQHKNNVQIGQERIYWIPLKKCDTE